MQLVEKWKDLIYAAKAYWIDSVPTGMDDATFDELERRALEEDGFSARDYVFNTYLKGTRTENKYIEKIKKQKVEGMTMLQAIKKKKEELGKDIYVTGKLDGSSIAIYINSETGEPMREVTVGNQNLPTDTGSKTSTGFGIDQTWKLHKFIPRFPKGIVAVQCEALLDLNNLPDKTDPDRARQQANAYINSIYLQDEVDEYLTLRAYRYYTSDTADGVAIREMDYRDVISSFPIVRNEKGVIKFAPIDVFTIDDLEKHPGTLESNRQMLSTGLFLFDGTVLYDTHGVCQGALKFAGAGSESDGVVTTTVRSLKFNDQSKKGKDSWSVNLIVDPVVLHGSTVTKPSGSIGKIVKEKIGPGAVVSLVMAQEVIPTVKKCISPGGTITYPTCTCGYQMSDKDIYGSRLKCGNTRCSVREDRMKNYLRSLGDISELDLNKFLVIDGLDLGKLDIDKYRLIEIATEYISGSEPDRDFFGEFRGYLAGYMNTDARRRNLDLVVESAWESLIDVMKNG